MKRIAFVIGYSLLLLPALQGQVYEFYELQINGVDGVDGLEGSYGIAISPDGKHVYTGSSTDDAVAVFSKSGVGTLTFVEQHVDDGLGGTIDGLSDAKRLAISPDGKHVYVPTSGDDALVVFSRNSSTGALTYVETHKDGVSGVDGLNGAHQVCISPDNKHVYVVGYIDDAVAVFSRNTSTGSLTYVEAQFDGVGGVDGLNNARGVAISGDGAHLYIASATDDALAVFSRNSTTGALTYVEQQEDGVSGVDGLNGAYGLCVSPDGSHVYVASFTDDAVAGFSRNSSTGALTYLEVHKDDTQGGAITNLNAARYPAITADGKYVAVVSSSDHALTIFARNSSTGLLLFQEEKVDGAGGVDGLNGGRMVAISPDDFNFFTISTGDDALTVFTENSILSPLDLSFTITEIPARGLEISWETRPGPDHAYLLERSIDGRAWTAIDQLLSSNPSESQLHAIMDGEPLEGKSYYRLVQTDLEGKQLASHIESVTFSRSQAVRVFPNPAKESLSIQLAKPARWGSIELINLQGESLMKESIQPETSMELNVQFLAPGLYFLNLSLEEVPSVHIFKKG